MRHESCPKSLNCYRPQSYLFTCDISIGICHAHVALKIWSNSGCWCGCCWSLGGCLVVIIECFHEWFFFEETFCWPLVIMVNHIDQYIILYMMNLNSWYKNLNLWIRTFDLWAKDFGKNPLASLSLHKVAVLQTTSSKNNKININLYLLDNSYLTSCIVLVDIMKHLLHLLYQIDKYPWTVHFWYGLLSCVSNLSYNL